MAPSAHRIAREYLLGHLRQAKSPEEEHRPGDVWRTDKGYWRAQNPQGQPQSFPEKGPADAWAKGQGTPQGDEQPQKGQPQQPDEGIDKFKKGPHSEVALKTLDIARSGKEISRKTISGGAADKTDAEKMKLPGMNQSFIVELEHNGKREKFVYKPAEGEEEGLSVSVPGGSYHQREQAAYGLDALVGGRTVVPPTITKGDKGGSYQAFAEGAQGINTFESMNDLVDKVPLEELVKNPDFERLNVMDLMMGHEDRHMGNVMVRFEGEEKPENLRLVAIDNGIAMGGKLPDAKDYGYRNPFEQWASVKDFGSDGTGKADAAPDEGTVKIDKTRKVDEGTAKVDDDMPSAKEIESQFNELEMNAKDSGVKAIKKTLGSLSPELHKQIKAVKLPAAVKAMADSGLGDQDAVRGQIVRMAAMQADPKIFEKVLDKNNGDLEKAWRSFQYMSHGNELLELAGASDRVGEIDEAVKEGAPEGGWEPAEKFEVRRDKILAARKKMEDGFIDWGAPTPKRSPGAIQRTAPIQDDPETKKDDDKGVKYDDWGFAMARVQERWLRQVLSSARLRTKS